MCCSERTKQNDDDGNKHNNINNNNNKNENSDWLEAYVTFVTLDPHTKRPMAIPPIVPETAEEIKEFQDGAQRALLKKQHRQHHQEHVESSNNSNNNKNNNNPTANRIETLARELLQQSSALLNLPSLANPHDILIDQTAMQNAMIAQPQVQNLHNRIFGGFLMRRAFELAFATVYCFAGARPIFLEVDQVSFSLPVDVGDLLIFNSHILYTDTGRLVDYYNDEYNDKNNNKNSNHCQPPHNDKEQGQSEILLDDDEKEVVPLVHVEVQAYVTVPEEAKAQVSNLFHFTFGIVPEKKMMMMMKDDDNNNNNINENYKQEATEKPAPSIRRVLPSNIEQARRMATRMIANEEQQQLSNQLFLKRQEQQQERTRD